MRLQDMDEQKIPGSGFKFSGVRTEHLGASEYTLVNIGGDATGTICGYEPQVLECLKKAVESCKKSPRAENLLIRVFLFSSRFPNGIDEIHGYKPLSDIDVNSYPAFTGGGGTPLYDALFSAVGSTNAYAEQLMKDDFPSNGISVIITDGDDNDSVTSPAQVKKEIAKSVQGEHIESNIVILVGINAARYQQELEAIKTNVGIDKYIDAGDATPGKLAKLAEFVSQSVSSQSQALGTGGPSQNIAATI